jgi:hypothetical protein
MEVAAGGLGARTGDQTFNFVNSALSVVAIIFSCLALGAVVMHAILYPQIVDAKIAAGVAKAEATAHTAETHARVALDKVETAETELGKKGINIRTDGH